MINLIKTELLKVRHKRSLYLLLTLMLIFCFLNNYLYYRDYDNDGNYKYENQESLTLEKSNIEEELKQAQLNSTDYTLKASLQTKLDLINLKENFPTTSWQYQKIDDYFYDLLYNLNVNKITLTSTNQDTLLATYQEYLDKLNNNDYLYFLNLELTNLTLTLQSLNTDLDNTTDLLEKDTINKAIVEKTSEKEKIEYRLQEKIPNDKSYLSKAVDNYYEASLYLKNNPPHANLTRDEEITYRKKLAQKEINKYILEKKVNVNKENTLNYNLRTLTKDYEIFLIMFLLFITTILLCDEFSQGTIKLLLIKPYSRCKILLGKYLSAIVLFTLCVVFLIIIELIFGGLFLGTSSLTNPVVVYNYLEGKVVEYPLIKYILIYFSATIPFYLIILTIAFTIAITTTSSPLTLITTLILYMFTSVIQKLALQNNLPWLKYLINLNWDFTTYLFGEVSSYPQVHLAFSSLLWLIYFLSLTFLNNLVFSQKNIKNI